MLILVSEVNEETNSHVIDYFENISSLIKEKKLNGITNLTPSYNKLIISFDLSIINFLKIKDIIQNLNIVRNLEKKNIQITIPVCCDEEYGLDFERLSRKLKLSKDEILKFYFNKEYFCYMTGFIAGMPFLGDIDSKIRCDRLETPRVRVPKGSVGITEHLQIFILLKAQGDGI